MRPFTTLAVVVAILTGSLVGLGAYTFSYAEGPSYYRPAGVQELSRHERSICVMAARAASRRGRLRRLSPAARVRSENARKANNGYWHSKGFTLMDFHEPIMIGPRNAGIPQANYLRCHGDFCSRHRPRVRRIARTRFVACTVIAARRPRVRDP